MTLHGIWTKSSRHAAHPGSPNCEYSIFVGNGADAHRHLNLCILSLFNALSEEEKVFYWSLGKGSYFLMQYFCLHPSEVFLSSEYSLKRRQSLRRYVYRKSRRERDKEYERLPYQTSSLQGIGTYITSKRTLHPYAPPNPSNRDGCRRGQRV